MKKINDTNNLKSFDFESCNNKLNESPAMLFNPYISPKIWEKSLSFSELDFLECQSPSAKKMKQEPKSKKIYANSFFSNDELDELSYTNSPSVESLEYIGLNPKVEKLSFDDLKVKPFYSKSKKKFIDVSEKDISYWKKRIKNNLAAKKSRESKRMKDTQIALRARYLEEENEGLKLKLFKMENENIELRNRLSAYENGVSSITDMEINETVNTFVDEIINDLDDLLD